MSLEVSFPSKSGDLFWKKGRNLVEVKVELVKGQLVLKSCDPILQQIISKHKLVDKRTVTLEKNAKGELGISIIGGISGKKPITINRVIKDSPASLSQVKANDILMKVNGVPTWNKTKKQVADELKNSEIVTLCLVQLERRNKEEESREEEAKWASLEVIDLMFSFSSVYQSRADGDASNGFEVQTKEGVSYSFLCSSVPKSNLQWVEAITETCRVLSTRKLQMLSMASDVVEGQVKADVEMVGSAQESLPSNTHTSIWQQKVLVLSGFDLQIFQYWPEALYEWIHPEVKYKILEISYRKVDKPRENCLALYWGKGVNHLLSFGTARERHRWIEKLNSVSRAAAQSIKSQSFLGKWRGREISFTVDIECGFSLWDNSGEQEMPKLLWKEELHNLHSTTDDGSSQLKLSFTDGYSFIIQLQDMHTALCVMQNIYLAKMIK